jgi:Effector-associated domain 1
MSQLTGAQKASLIDALLSGYTSDDQLTELLALHLDTKLAEIAEDGTLREQVFAVVMWAEAHGRTKDLALQAQRHRPRNEALGAFVDAHYPGERVQPPPQSRPFESRSQSSMLVYGAVAVAAVLLAILIIARPWRGPDDGGNKGNGGSGGETTKDRPRLPATMQFKELTGVDRGDRVVVDARFTPPRLESGSVLWFVVGSGQRCRERVHRAQVDNPSLGYMTSIIKPERARPTCAQLLVEDANGQAIARSDPREIAFAPR